jgi:nitrous oxide reductase accessory protein NosL
MRAAALLALAVVFTGCASVKPVPIRAGDVCFHCRQPISNIAMAAEVISDEGHAFKFSSVACLADYLRDHPDETLRATFVTDYPRGRMLSAQRAYYVKFTVDPRLSTVDFAAFRDEDAARAFAEQHRTTLVRWNDVLADDFGHGH